jgi:serine/threonine protein kinase
MNKPQKGGIRILDTYNIHTAFHHFLTNSTAKIISTKSKTCFVYALTLNDDAETPYESIRSNAFFSDDEDLKKIRKLVVKVAVVNDDANEEDLTWGGQHVYMTTDEFKLEIDNQTDIFNATLHELEPCCPSIVFADIFMKDIIESKFKGMRHINIVEDSKVGIIAMELADGYEDLHHVRDNIDYEKLAIYELCRFASNGFLHCDPHAGNILINETYEYVADLRGRALLIDFGDIKRITPIPITGNAERVITMLLDDDTWDSGGYNRRWPSYSWLKKFEKPSTTDFVNELHESRLEKMQQFYERTGTTTSAVDAFLRASHIFTGTGGKKKRKIKGRRTRKGGRVETMRQTSKVHHLDKQPTLKQHAPHTEGAKFKELVGYLEQEKLHGDRIKKYAKRFNKNYVSLEKL